MKMVQCLCWGAGFCCNFPLRGQKTELVFAAASVQICLLCACAMRVCLLFYLYFLSYLYFAFLYMKGEIEDVTSVGVRTYYTFYLFVYCWFFHFLFNTSFLMSPFPSFFLHALFRILRHKNTLIYVYM